MAEREGDCSWDDTKKCKFSGSLGLSERNFYFF